MKLDINTSSLLLEISETECQLIIDENTSRVSKKKEPLKEHVDLLVKEWFCKNLTLTMVF